jgi:hypothetical protein
MRALSCRMSNPASLYAGALVQLTMGRIGCSVLCILSRPLMVGGDGLRLMTVQFCSGGINCRNWLIVDRKAFWNFLVGLGSKVLKLLSDMNCEILLLYSCKYITTKVLPLSAFMIVALLRLSLDLMQRRICCSCFACKLLWLCS